MAARTAIVTLVGISPYSQSRAHDEPQLEKESKDDHDKRTWRMKAHFNPETREVVIPAMGLKLAIAEAARRLSIKIPGKGKATYTKNVVSGVIVAADIGLGITVDELQSETVFVNSDGIRGSGSRVHKRFPMIPSGWKGSATIIITDDEIPEKIIEKCLEEAGNLIGIGRFRPQNMGFLGRFEVKSLKWNKAASDRKEAA